MIPVPGKTTLVAAAISGVIAFGAGWQVASWRLDGAHTRAIAKKDQIIADMREAAAKDLAKANAEALDEYARLEAKKQAAVDAAAEQAQRNAAAADRARSDADRLRAQLATADRVSTATVASLREYTTTLQSVFGECLIEYREMGKAADGHATDSRALREAWPL